MHKLDTKHLEYAKTLLENTDLHKLKVLYLNGGTEMSLLKLRDILPHLFRITKKQIFLDSFELNEEDLAMIFEHCVKVKKLALVNCKIAHLGEDFYISQEQKYKLRELDLFWSCIKDKDDYLHGKKLHHFIQRLRDSNIEEHLKKIHVWEEDYPKYET